MPTAVQDIGNIEVVTWDKKQGQMRPIDVIDFNDLKTESGAIEKVAGSFGVKASKDVTGLPDQTYFFQYQLKHRVPVNGYFSFLLSEDEANGVKVSDNSLVENSCYLMEGASETGKATPVKCATGVTEQGRSFVNITCIPSVFGNGGTAADSKLMFKIGGLTNPRFKDFVSEFKLYTMDA